MRAEEPSPSGKFSELSRTVGAAPIKTDARGSPQIAGRGRSAIAHLLAAVVLFGPSAAAANPVAPQAPSREEVARFVSGENYEVTPWGDMYQVMTKEGLLLFLKQNSEGTWVECDKEGRDLEQIYRDFKANLTENRTGAIVNLVTPRDVQSAAQAQFITVRVNSYPHIGKLLTMGIKNGRPWVRDSENPQDYSFNPYLDSRLPQEQAHRE